MARPSTFQSLKAAFTSRRVGAVTFQSFSSGLPLGLIIKALPAWMPFAGFDVKTIGLVQLVQAPWSFKFLWSPLMDRYRIPLFGLGRKRSWMLLSQLMLALSIGLFAWHSASPTVWGVVGLCLLIVFWSATQDIAVDGYAVEVLEKEEQGVAVGARTSMYVLAMRLSGAFAITASVWLGWPALFAGIALLYLPMMMIVVASPEPPGPGAPPVSLRAAVFEPLVGVFRKPRALEIIAFVLLYKLGDNLATALTSPFLLERCFTRADVGLASLTVGLIATLVGTMIGGVVTQRIGLGPALWLCGILQALSNLAYIPVDLGVSSEMVESCKAAVAAGRDGGGQAAWNRVLMYGAISFDTIAQGMGTGAFSVLLLRMTQKRFSSTQYAVFSSVFGLGRALAGPPAGILVDALGWTPFFVISVFAAIPGMVMLQRFAPWGVRDPVVDTEDADATIAPNPVSRMALAGFTVLAAVAGFTLSVLTSALLGALKAARTKTDTFVPEKFDFMLSLNTLVTPDNAAEWLKLAGPTITGVVIGLFAAALIAARRGVK